MQHNLTQVLEACAQQSYAGEISFGEVVGRLIGVGVESYLTDFRRAETTYYLPDGSTRTMPLDVPAKPVAPSFDNAALLAAIRGAQRNEVKYPEFLQRALAAGCAGYIVWIAGKHVSYFGRRGEMHIEHFPSPQD